LLRGLDWEATGRVASLMGAIKIESRGPQNHRFTEAEFDQRFQRISINRHQDDKT
jgi:adenosine kinase